MTFSSRPSIVGTSYNEATMRLIAPPAWTWLQPGLRVLRQGLGRQFGEKRSLPRGKFRTERSLPKPRQSVHFVHSPWLPEFHPPLVVPRDIPRKIPPGSHEGASVAGRGEWAGSGSSSSDYGALPRTGTLINRLFDIRGAQWRIEARNIISYIISCWYCVSILC